jgi:uncharacterized DUF497 family protein
MEFVWNHRNAEHIGEHGVTPWDAEEIVREARPPYPQALGDGKRLVVGKLADGRFVQVIYVPSRSRPGAVYVVHARPLTDPEKRRFRRRKK